ncbi:MAG: galactose-1-phosphate uridylyltransferase [Bacilli bacterium]|jgi:UDPglucose--hexose-1-phosphate uridylyltransferase|nr:galactose-1-phosphate uridylyltransferase [Bacilli bacterium]
MIEKTLKEAIAYAKSHLGLKDEDAIYFQNLLLHEFGLKEPYQGEIDEKKIAAYSLPDPIVDSLIEDLVSSGMGPGESQRKATYVMGLLSPTPSQVDEKFASLDKESPEKATEYLYDLSIKNDYIAKSKVDKNIHWVAKYDHGDDLEISINLSKPEKNNKDIAKLLSKNVAVTYPKCLLCEENIGFEGTDSHPARENIRFVPLKLNGEDWFMQYSPYVYYSHHCIVFYKKHVPMKISGETLKAFGDFVDQFPHFFIGSNSDLPIVGGSILNHEHFQGGGHLLPLLISKDKETVYTSKKGSKVSILDFYVTSIKIMGSDKDDVLSLGTKVIDKWRHYSDPDNEIISDDSDGNHSTVTPFMRKIDGQYAVYLVLRNNRCSKAYPDGIFHAHPEYHHIKKEGIGLIEAAGLFILPARLKRESAEVEEAVSMDKKDYLAKYPDLVSFEGMIDEMKATHETSEAYINKVCQGILKNVAVYKDDEKGQEGLHKFIKETFHE